MPLIFAAVIFLLFSCTGTADIIQKDFNYEKMYFNTHRVEYRFHLENIKNSGRIAKLIEKLIYHNKNFEQYTAYAENEFTIKFDESDYPPFLNDYEEPYFYQSSLYEIYDIIHDDDSFIIFYHEKYVYYSGNAHGLPLVDFLIIDVAEEKLLKADDIAGAFPNALLHEYIIKKQKNMAAHLDYDNSADIYFRENLWPPDAIRLNGAGIEMIWNVYTIMPYAHGIINILIPYEAGDLYLTEKGRALKNSVTLP